MTYRFGDSSVIQGISEADLASGYRVLDTGVWRAAASDGAATANVGVGNTFARNIKAWSFANAQNKRIVCSNNEAFISMPFGALTTAKVSFMWGARASTSGTDVRWVFEAIQSQTDDQYIDQTDAHVRDLIGYTTSTEPANQNAYKIETITLDLAGAGWEDRPTMFVLGRNGNAAVDDLGAAAIVYGIQILVK